MALTFGDITVDTVIELALDPAFPLLDFFPDLNGAEHETARKAADMSLLHGRFLDEATKTLRMSIHTWLVRAGDQVILIDTCCGNDKSRPDFPIANQLSVPYLERLEAAGVRAQDVDFVLCTHLHVDHCGWNTRLRDGRWVPTFPNARYIFSRNEYDQWNTADPTYNKSPVNKNVFEDSILPIIEHGQADMIHGTHTIGTHLRVEPTPGHTFGSVSLKVESGGTKGIFCGDVLHHPLQILMPDLNSGFCEAPTLARHTRRRVLGYCADEGGLLMPAHFAPPHAVAISRSGDNFTFKPVL